MILRRNEADAQKYLQYSHRIPEGSKKEEEVQVFCHFLFLLYYLSRKKLNLYHPPLTLPFLSFYQNPFFFPFRVLARVLLPVGQNERDLLYALNLVHLLGVAYPRPGMHCAFGPSAPFLDWISTRAFSHAGRNSFLSVLFVLLCRWNNNTWCNVDCTRKKVSSYLISMSN